MILMRPKKWFNSLKRKEIPEVRNEQSGQDHTLNIPIEIIVAIFAYLGRNSASLAQVTAVCRRWRVIAIQAPLLWTRIEVHLDSLSKKQVKTLLTRVELFLDRTDDLLLEVKWITYTDMDMQHIPLFYNLFREKGSFSRWESLYLSLGQGLAHDLGERRESDYFQNLKCLRIHQSPPPAYLRLISDTVTSSLRTLELGSNVQFLPALIDEYNRLLSHINTLRIDKRALVPPLLLPPNVTSVDAWTISGLSSPHIEDLVVWDIGSIEQFATHDLSNLVRLYIVLPHSKPLASRTITLPNLLCLTVDGRALPVLSALRTPMLHTLVIIGLMSETQDAEGSLASGLRSGFDGSAVIVLKLKLRMDGPAFCEIVRHFPQVQYLSVLVQSATEGREILSHAFLNSDNSMREEELARGTTTLKRLRLLLNETPEDKPGWEAFTRRAANGIGDPLRRLTVCYPEGRYTYITSAPSTPDWPAYPIALERFLGNSPWLS